MNANDTNWFRPLWRRITVLVVVCIWSALEWWNHDQTWGLVTLALIAYCVWTFFIKFPPAPTAPPLPKPDDETPPQA